MPTNWSPYLWCGSNESWNSILLSPSQINTSVYPYSGPSEAQEIYRLKSRKSNSQISRNALFNNLLDESKTFPIIDDFIGG